MSSPDLAAPTGTVRLTVPRAGVAVVAALLVALVVARYGLTPQGAVAGAFAAVLVWLSAIDLRERRLPNRITLPATALFLTANCALFPEHAAEWVLAALGAGGFMLLAALIQPNGLGMGDVKLALLLGAGLGRPVVAALALGFVAIVPVALALFAIHGGRAAKMTVPLAPFLAFGAIAVLLIGVPAP